MTDIITIVAYKQNAVDTCRGCVMSRHDSDLKMFTTDNPDDATDFVAARLAEDIDEYNSFDFTYFVNGRTIDDGGQYVPESFPENLDYEIFDQHEALINKVKTEASTRVAAIVAERKAAKEKKEREEAARAVRAREQNERRQYEALRAKFGDES